MRDENLMGRRDELSLLRGVVFEVYDAVSSGY
jgi:hypothetical protein